MKKRTSTTLIVIHTTAVRPNQQSGVKEVGAWHRARWGSKYPGYHYIIRRGGTVETGRPRSLWGAHVAGFNSNSIGIAYEGGLDGNGNPSDTRTPQQNKALITLIKKLQKTYKEARVCGHRDLSPDRDGDGFIEPHEHLKACPCFDAIPWAESVGLKAASIRGVWTSRSNPHPVGPDAKAVRLQKLLRAAGYEFGPVDGFIGPKTTAAIKRFQEAADIAITGKFDTSTVGRLETIAEARNNPIRKNFAKEVQDINLSIGSGELLTKLKRPKFLTSILNIFTSLWRPT